MNDKNVKSVCRIVREMMKVDGRRLIFTNLYSTGTRTVKCYASDWVDRDGRDERMIENIKNVLIKLNVPEFVVRKTPGREYGGPGIIFKFPVQK